MVAVDLGQRALPGVDVSPGGSAAIASPRVSSIPNRFTLTA